ncbi:MAG TPA: nucleotide exchange factor GrpE [Solirubrobacteraceae bacterium]|jgi:molecular chaperone GrpE|nr:nucleotide exchange factor GrpE [Solirubrobacteraceae bacterium]
MSDITEQAIEDDQLSHSHDPGVPEAPGDESAGAPAQPPTEEGALPDGPSGSAPEQDEVSEFEGDLDELVAIAAQRDEYLALAQRTQADFENYRKRVAKESAAAAERGVAKLAKELLPALDNLDRALEAADQEEARRASGQRPAGGRPSPSDRGPGGPAEDSLLLDGVRLVRAELSAALARVGVESFDPKGERFDPAHHEAMLSQPVEGTAGGTVVEVYQPGYRLNGTVIRPARVVVAA